MPLPTATMISAITTTIIIKEIIWKPIEHITATAIATATTKATTTVTTTATITTKITAKLKTLDQKLKVISIVTAQAMVEDQPDLTQYKMTQFYDTRKMPDNPDWYAEDTLLNAYGKSIYQDKTLVAYKNNDPMFIQEQELNRVNNNISRLEAELEVLRNENNR